MASDYNVLRNESLSAKLHETMKQKMFLASHQFNLIAVVDDNILVWSAEDCCFYAQHIEQKDAPIQTLHVTRPPLWSVVSIAVNKSGTGVLLVGRRGVGVVDLPQRWGKNCTFDGGKDSITCRIEYVAERFLVCQQKVNVVSAQWHPGSPLQNHIVMLATDHYLRVYSLRSRDVPEQALCISAARPSNIFNSNSSTSVGSALGKEPVGFTIGAPYVSPKMTSSDVGEETYDVSDDLLWPTFVLYRNGDVYHTTLSMHHHKVRSHSVSGPLLLFPPREDNYEFEWCSIGWLGQSASVQGVGGVLLLATSAGRMHHCVIMPLKKEHPNEEVEKKTALEESLSALRVSEAVVSLFVYESVDLEVTLLPQQATEQTFVILPHSASLNRYFVLHCLGIHSVTVPLVDSLRHLTATVDNNYQLEDMTDCECEVDHMLCTGALQHNPLPVFGAALWSASSSRRELLALLSSGSIIRVKVTADVPTLPLVESLHKIKKEGVANSSSDSFESLIASVLQRNSSQPILFSGSSEALHSSDCLDLTNRTLHTLRNEYIVPQVKARQLIDHRIRVLCDQQKALVGHLSALQSKRLQLVKQNEALIAAQKETAQRQEKIAQRLDELVSKAVRCLPGLCGGERWFLKQLQSIQEQIPHLRDDVSHLRTKVDWQQNINKVQQPPEESAAELKLSQTQLTVLKRSIGSESDKIEKLLSRYNDMKKNLEL